MRPRRIGYAAGGEVGAAMSPAGTSDPSASTGAMPKYPVSDPVIMSMSLDDRQSNPANYNEDREARATRPAQAPIVPPQMRFAKGGLVTGYQDGGDVEDDDDDDEVETGGADDEDEKLTRRQMKEADVASAEEGEEGATDGADVAEEDEKGQRTRPQTGYQAGGADAGEAETGGEAETEAGGAAAAQQAGGEEASGGQQLAKAKSPDLEESQPWQVAGADMPPGKDSQRTLDEARRQAEQDKQGQTGYAPGGGAVDKATAALKVALSFTQRAFGLTGGGQAQQQPQQPQPQPQQQPSPPQQPEQSTGALVQEPQTTPPQTTPTGAPQQQLVTPQAPQGPTNFGPDQVGRQQPAGQQPAGQQGALRAYMQGQGGFTPEQMTQLLDQTTGPAHKGNQNEALYKTFSDLVNGGRMADAGKMLQSLRPSYDNVRAVMMAAVGQGDYTKAMQLADKLNDLLPNGRTLDFSRRQDGQFTAMVHAPDGKVTSFSLTPEQFQQYAMGPASLFDYQGTKGLEGTLAQLTGAGGYQSTTATQGTPEGEAARRGLSGQIADREPGRYTARDRETQNRIADENKEAFKHPMLPGSSPDPLNPWAYRDTPGRRLATTGYRSLDEHMRDQQEGEHAGSDVIGTGTTPKPNVPVEMQPDNETKGQSQQTGYGTAGRTHLSAFDVQPNADGRYHGRDTPETREFERIRHEAAMAGKPLPKGTAIPPEMRSEKWTDGRGGVHEGGIRNYPGTDDFGTFDPKTHMPIKMPVPRESREPPEFSSDPLRPETRRRFNAIFGEGVGGANPYRGLSDFLMRNKPGPAPPNPYGIKEIPHTEHELPDDVRERLHQSAIRTGGTLEQTGWKPPSAPSTRGQMAGPGVPSNMREDEGQPRSQPQRTAQTNQPSAFDPTAVEQLQRKYATPQTGYNAGQVPRQQPRLDQNGYPILERGDPGYRPGKLDEGGRPISQYLPAAGAQKAPVNVYRPGQPVQTMYPGGQGPPQQRQPQAALTPQSGVSGMQHPSSPQLRQQILDGVRRDFPQNDKNNIQGRTLDARMKAYTAEYNTRERQQMLFNQQRDIQGQQNTRQQNQIDATHQNVIANINSRNLATLMRSEDLNSQQTMLNYRQRKEKDPNYQPDATEQAVISRAARKALSAGMANPNQLLPEGQRQTTETPGTMMRPGAVDLSTYKGNVPPPGHDLKTGFAWYPGKDGTDWQARPIKPARPESRQETPAPSRQEAPAPQQPPPVQQPAPPPSRRDKFLEDWNRRMRTGF